MRGVGATPACDTDAQELEKRLAARKRLLRLHVQLQRIAEHGAERDNVGAIGRGTADLLRLLRAEPGRKKRVLAVMGVVDHRSKLADRPFDRAWTALRHRVLGAPHRHLEHPLAESLIQSSPTKVTDHERIIDRAQ